MPTLNFAINPRPNTCAVKRCMARATHDGLCERHDIEAKEQGIVPPWREGGAAPGQPTGQPTRATAMQKAARGGPEVELAELRAALAAEIGPVDGLGKLRTAAERAPLGAGAEWAAAEALLGKIHEKGKTIAAWQKSQTAPLMAVVKAYQDAFRPYARALEDAKAMLKRRMSAELAVRSARLQADLVAASEGDQEALARAGAATSAPSAKGARTVREWRFAGNKTYADLPMEYLQPDWDKLEKLAREASAPGPALEGCIVITEREVMVARAQPRD